MKDTSKIVIAFIIYFGTFMFAMNALYAEEISTHEFPVEFTGTNEYKDLVLILYNVDKPFQVGTRFNFLYPGDRPLVGSVLIETVAVVKPGVYRGRLTVQFGNSKAESGTYLARFDKVRLFKFRITVEGIPLTFERNTDEQKDI